VAASVRENFGANLRRLLADARRDTGMTQETFAEKLGVLPQKVSQWKAGVFPRPEQIDAIAAALDVPAAELFRDREAAVENLISELAKRAGFEVVKRPKP